jgi:hypothetical protein
MYIDVRTPSRSRSRTIVSWSRWNLAEISRISSSNIYTSVVLCVQKVLNFLGIIQPPKTFFLERREWLERGKGWENTMCDLSYLIGVWLPNWSGAFYLFYLLVVVSFMVILFFIRCDDIDLIKEKSRSWWGAGHVRAPPFVGVNLGPH